MKGRPPGEERESDLFFDGELLARQFRHFQLLFVALKAGIPALLADGPRTLTEISSALGLAAPRLQRVLRGLVWCHALETDAAGAYLLTAPGKALLEESPFSLASSIRFQGEFFFNAWGHLWDYLEGGETPFQRAHNGANLFEILANNEELATLFGAPMTQHSAELSRQITMHPAFATLPTDFPLVVDVGGGEGRLLADILKAYPHTQGILLELPIMEAAATRLLVGEGLSQRCQFVGGNMLEAVPENGDLYLLKWVLHDWNDADAVRILKRCAAAMRPRHKENHGSQNVSCLLVIERLMPDIVDTTNTGMVQADLNMLCQMGGAERSLAEYESLLSTAGLSLRSTQSLDSVRGFVALDCILRR